ncbi:hypothetical protein Hanom_Chr15g01405311 [Helianthus anomalus]
MLGFRFGTDLNLQFDQLAQVRVWWGSYCSPLVLYFRGVTVGYVNHRVLESIWAVLMRMKHCGFCFDEDTFGSILKGVGSNECLFVKCV